MDQEQKKRMAAEAALQYVEDDMVIGVGTGSTVNYFIELLANKKHLIDGAVASSIETEKRLKAHGIRICDLNSEADLALYVDGADEVNKHLQLIKGGGGALTREKIVAAVAKKFVCIVDDSKIVKRLGEAFPLAIEVIPSARSYIGREMVKLGGDPDYRAGFTTDNHGIIIDVHYLDILDPIAMEKQINNLTGVVSNGLFAMRSADIVLVAGDNGIEKMTR